MSDVRRYEVEIVQTRTVRVWAESEEDAKRKVLTETGHLTALGFPSEITVKEVATPTEATT